MYCKSCGKQIDDDSKFCSFCGTKHTLNFVTSGTKPIIEERPITKQVANQQTEKKEIKQVGVAQKYDLTYKKEVSARIVGILLVIFIAVDFVFGQVFVKLNNINVDTAIEFLGVFTVVIRIISTVWVVAIAKRQNRNTGGWAILAFLTPAIILIIIGSTKKLLYPSNYNAMNNEAKSQINNNIAFAFMQKKDYNNALYMADIAISLYSENHFAYDTRGNIKYFLKQYDEALNDINVSINLDSTHSIKYFHRGYVKKELGDSDGACSDWRLALTNGYGDAKEPLKKYCSEY